VTTQDIVGEYRIEVETGGYCRFDVQLTNSPHQHDYYEICLVLSGQGVYYHGGQSFRLQPGTVFVAVPGVIHEITSFETKDLSLYFIIVTIQRLEVTKEIGEGALIQAFLDGPMIARSGFESLSGYAEIIEGARPIDWNLRAQSLRLFALEMLGALCPESSAESIRQPPSDISVALKFIDASLDRSLRVSEIAQHLAISERTLRRRFQEWFGASIVEEINHRRMRRAAHRLLMGFSATEVAEFSGIADPAQFSRSFKKTMGKSPKEFQKTYRPGALSKQTR
jgi:AraC-like DNA-binding protein/mannose-6-phosphate isomerase-like protein (cupin superfamily)